MSRPIGTLIRELWDAYPALGRVKMGIVETYYCGMLAPLGDEERETFHASLLACWKPGGKWAESRQVAAGFVPMLPNWLAEKRWMEDPQPRTVNGTSSHSKELCGLCGGWGNIPNAAGGFTPCACKGAK